MSQLTSVFDYFNVLWFTILPYVAIFTFLLVTIQRYTRRGFSYSSLSSQFLENSVHFWGLVPFHYGIIFILTGHFVAFLVPEQILFWNSNYIRLFILEISSVTRKANLFEVSKPTVSSRAISSSILLMMFEYF